MRYRHRLPRLLKYIFAGSSFRGLPAPPAHHGGRGVLLAAILLAALRTQLQGDLPGLASIRHVAGSTSRPLAPASVLSILSSDHHDGVTIRGVGISERSQSSFALPITPMYHISVSGHVL